MKLRLLVPFGFALVGLSGSLLADEADELIKAYDESYDQFIQAYSTAESDEDRQKVLSELYPSPADWVAKFWVLVEKEKVSEAASKATFWIARNAQQASDQEKALELITENWALSKDIGDVLSRIYENKAAGPLLETVYIDHENPETQGAAGMYLALWQREHTKTPVAEIVSLLEDVSIEFGEHPHPFRQDKTLADAIRGHRFELENLMVGMKVPEIEGQDIDGVSFKLSDYRGKVVLLDYWAHW